MARKKPKSTTVDPDKVDDPNKVDDSSTEKNSEISKEAEVARKQEAIDGVETPKKRERVSWKAKAATLQAELDTKTAEIVKTKPEEMAIISNGLFQMMEGLTKLPLTKCNPALKEGFDQSAAICMDTYISTNLGKWQPLIQLGTLSLLITSEAVRIKGEEKKKQKSDPDKQLAPVES